MRFLVLVAFAAVAAAREPVEIAIETSHERCFVQESVRVRLVVRYDAAFFEKQVVQTFHKRFDLPVQVSAPWLDSLEGVVARETPAAEGASFVLNGRPAVGVRGEGTLTVERVYLPTREGELRLDAPTISFSHATRFEEDFVHGRLPLDRTDTKITGTPLTITVEPLPDPPTGFSGAVGRFTVEAELVALELTLRIRGDGNLDLFDTPRLDGVAGIHVLGALDDRARPVRTIVYELERTDPREPAIPPIAFTAFDPKTRVYRTTRTQRFPLPVAQPPPAPPTTPPEHPLPWWPFALGALVVVAGVLLMRRRPPDPVAEYRTDPDRAGAFVRFLARKLDCPEASVISPDLAERLVAQGAPEELAARTAQFVERLVAQRYGGTTSDTDDEAARLIAELG